MVSDVEQDALAVIDAVEREMAKRDLHPGIGVAICLTAAASMVARQDSPRATEDAAALLRHLCATYTAAERGLHH